MCSLNAWKRDEIFLLGNTSKFEETKKHYAQKTLMTFCVFDGTLALGGKQRVMHLQLKKPDAGPVLLQ